MMGFRTQEVVFVPDAEEGWKLRDWIPWESWNLPSKSKAGRRTSSPSLVQRRATSPNPAPGVEDVQRWHAFDIFSLGVIHLYLCLGQVEARGILEHVRMGRSH